MKSYCEEDVNLAIQAVHMGRSIRKAALEWGVPRATLQDRLNGTPTMQVAKSGSQRLSPVLKDHVTQWILIQAAVSLPPTHAQVWEFVQRILKT